MSRTFPPSTASLHPMKRSGFGSRNSGRRSPRRSAAIGPGRPAGRWHLDEVVLKINGVKHWLRSATDADCDVLDILVQSQRGTAALKRFMRNLFGR